MSRARYSGTCAPSAQTSFTVSARPSALRSVRYSSAPWAASRKAVARPMPLAAPVIKHRLPANVVFPMGTDDTGLGGPPAAVHVSVVAKESRVAGQHLGGCDRQRADQRRDVVADGVGGAGS